jgi:PAS domain S-box-containing protein
MTNPSGLGREKDLPYRSLFDNPRYGTAYCQLLASSAAEDFLILAANQTLEQWATAGPLAGKWASVAFPGFRKQIEANIVLCRTVVGSGRPQQCELWSQDPRQCLSISLFPVDDERFIMVVDDITAAKNAEEDLRASRNLLTNISKQVPGMVFQLRRSPKGRFSFAYVSSGVGSILELPPEDLVKNPAWVFRRIHPEDVKPFFQKVQRAAEGQDPFHAEFRVVLALRGLRWLRADAVPEKQVDGTILWHGVIGDITDEKEAKIALEESKKFLENIINAVADPIFVKDKPGGPFLLFNDALCTLLGLTRQELIASSGRIHSPEAEHQFSLQIDEQVFATGIENFVQEPWTDKTGTVHTVVTKKTLYTDEGNHRFLVAVVQDVTERLKAEELLLRSQKLESLGVLAGGIAHDFNNLLGGLFAYLELAKGSVINGNSEKALHYLSKTLSVFGRAKNLTQQLLTFSKGGTPLLETLNLPLIIRAAADSAVEGTRITCEYAFQEDLWSCECDRLQISQVIVNLVTNAIQAMPGGGTVLISSENFESPHGPFLKLTIRDHGNGIPEENLSRIFDPFFSTRENGHGLGLATVHSIVLKHGGWIEVESEPKRGSAFHVFLPGSPVVEIPPVSFRKDSHHGSGRILVMDDEDLLRDAIQDMLESLGYSVTAVRDGSQALNSYQEALKSQTPFAAMILDLTIPQGMGGCAVAQAIRKADGNAILIAASGYADDPVMANPRGHGFTDRIVKPFLRRDLEELLDRVFSKENQDSP